MFRSHARTPNAERNTKSYSGHILNETKFGDGVNNARVNVTRRMQTKEYPLDMSYIRALYDMYYNDATIRRTEKLITDNLFQERPVFSINDEVLELTRQFQTVVDNEFMRFSRDAHVAYRCMGLVPIHYVVMASGYVVPRVLQPETFSISVYFDYLAEAQCYKVYRNVEGQMQEFSVKRIGTSSTTDHKGEHRAVLDALRHRDPRETASMRIDMGTRFPQNKEVDTTIFIYDSFSTRPSATGVLRSDIHTIYLMYNEMLTLKRLYYDSLRQTMTQVPFVQSEATNEEAANNDIGMSAYGQTMDLAELRAQDRFATQEADLNIVNELQRRERINRFMEHAQNHAADNASYEQSIDPRFDHSTRAQIRQFDASAPHFDTASKAKSYGRPLLPGEKLASYVQPQAKFEHLPLMLEHFRRETANILGASPVNFEMNRANQDQTALFLRNFFKTRHAFVTMHGQMITTVYNGIYKPKDQSFAAEQYFGVHMRTEVMRSFARDYKMYYAQIEKYEPRLFRLLQREAPKIQSAVISHLESERGATIDRKKNWFSSIGKSDRSDSSSAARIKRSDRVVPYTTLVKPGKMLESDHANSGERAWSRAFHEPQLARDFPGSEDTAKRALRDPVGALREMQDASGDSIENGTRAFKLVQNLQAAHDDERDYEDALIDEEIRALMFIGTLQSLSTETLFNLYSRGGEDKRAYLQKMYANYEKHVEGSHVSISFKSAANISLEDLLKRVTLGIISKKEAVDIVRTQMFMSRDTDKWNTKDMDLVINAMRSALADQTLGSLGVGSKRSLATSQSTDVSASPTASSNSGAKAAPSDGKRRKREELSKTSSSAADNATNSGSTKRVQSDESRATTSDT